MHKNYLYVPIRRHFTAGAGKSHQSLRDISLLSSIPNMKIYHPYNSIETKKILSYCINKEKNNCAIRLSIGPPPLVTPSLPKNYNFIPSKGINNNRQIKLRVKTLTAKERPSDQHNNPTPSRERLCPSSSTV